MTATLKKKKPNDRAERTLILMVILASASILSETKIVQQTVFPAVFPASSTTTMQQKEESTTSHHRSLRLNDIPIEPWISDEDCHVEFVDSQQQLCTTPTGDAFLDEIARDVVVRLLEYQFECSAQHLISNRVSTKSCLWIPPYDYSQTNVTNQNDVYWDGSNHQGAVDTVLFLLPFLYHNYYALMTYRKGYHATNCILVDTKKELPSQVSQVANLTYITLNDVPWRSVLSQARLCDYIASNSRHGLILADALGVPALALIAAGDDFPVIPQKKIQRDLTRISLYHRKRASLYTPAPERHNVTRAQAIVDSFPFDLFAATITTTMTKNVKKEASKNENKTLVIILGSLRGGEATWQSMHHNLLDVNNADLALMVGERNDTVESPFAVESPYQRAKYVWEFPEYTDWADAIDTINGTEWRSSDGRSVYHPLLQCIDQKLIFRNILERPKFNASLCSVFACFSKP